MKTQSTLALGFVLISLSGGPCFGQELGRNEATCRGHADGGCEISYNLMNSGKAYHRVQRLDEISGVWANVGEHNTPAAAGDVVEAGGLYRVVGCDDMDGQQNCESTTVFWSPVILPERDIPSRVAIADGDGGVTWAQISKEGPLMLQLRQLNVYLMSDLVVRNAGKFSGQMTPHRDHPNDPSLSRNIEHMIHADVYDQYTKLVKYHSSNAR